MVERMKYVNIMGPMDALDHAVDAYLSRYEIQLEYRLKELTNERGLTPLPTANPYAAVVRSAEKLLRLVGLDRWSIDGKRVVMGKQQAFNIITFAEEHFDKLENRTKEMEARRDECASALERLEPFKDLDLRVEDLARFAYIGYQFGKMPVAGLRQFETFLYNDGEIILLEGKTDETAVWCVYFAPTQSRGKVDAHFSSLHFERVTLPDNIGGEALSGYIADVCFQLRAETERLTKAIEQAGMELMEALGKSERVSVTRQELVAAYKVARDIEFYYDIRRFAAKTPNDFYIFVGWMPEREAKRLARDAADDASVVIIVEDGYEGVNSKPPTKLRNFVLFRPFEGFVTMYGLPSYGEIDPTAFVAATYTLLFGMMFGDLGQGFVLALLGLYLWKGRGFWLGKVLAVVGGSGAVFGVLFGSCFGFEFTPLLIRPSESATFTLMAAVFLGVGLIVMPMVMNIVNSVRRGKAVKAIFDPNGFAGLYFYVVVVASAAMILTGFRAVPVALVIALVAVPFFMIMFREPIRRKLSKRREEKREGIVMTLFESLIEMLEVLLAYFTNTISFVRVGAFALSHASMMGVVLMLAQNGGGGHNPIVIVVGNIFVIGLEGLIVGIQVLRLEFYEMFSRFYEGNGRQFTPYKINYK